MATVEEKVDRRTVAGRVDRRVDKRIEEYGVPTIGEARMLRQTTPVGSHVRFRCEDKLTGDPKIIEGTVIAVYPHIFMLHTGETYSWVEYMLGK